MLKTNNHVAGKDNNEELLEVNEELDEFQKDFIQFNSKYTVKPFSGRLVYVQSAEFSKAFLLMRIKKTWQSLSQNNIEVHTINCEHQSFFNYPNVRQLAEIIKKSLIPEA